METVVVNQFGVFIEIQSSISHRWIRTDRIISIYVKNEESKSGVALIMENDPDTWSIETPTVDEAMHIARVIAKIVNEERRGKCQATSK